MNSLFGTWASTLAKYLLLVFIIVVSALGFSHPAQAAERVYASYSALERSISVAALEDYALNGVVADDLAVYTRFLNPAQMEELRRVLNSRIKVNAVAVSQFLYTPQGEFMLQRLGQMIKTQSRQPEAGIYALRSALILAAAEPDGLTLLNLLREYPSPSIHIDLARSLGIAAELEKLVSETERAVAKVQTKANDEAALVDPSYQIPRNPDFRRLGNYAVETRERVRFFDALRNRFIFTDIYLPNAKGVRPVVIISHGLGSDSSNFRYLANHLASHGFAVVVPNHPGSDTNQLRSLISGSASQVAEPDEFYQRPRDIKFVLDELQKRNQTEFRGKFNLQQVGIFGQSFGGYTALALAGAEVNKATLSQSCHPKAVQDTWNVSLLLQCRILDPNQKQSPQVYSDLYDERIKAVIAVNPITSSVFGRDGLSQLKVPVMIVASSDDTVAPALYEQILPFAWIGNPQKYLAVLLGGTHFSAIGVGKSDSSQIGLPSTIVGDDPAQARKYINALSLPFFLSYVAGRNESKPFLNAAYAQAISRKPLGLSLVKSLTSNELAQAVNIDMDKFD